jgi:hypothetical protein
LLLIILNKKKVVMDFYHLLVLEIVSNNQLESGLSQKDPFSRRVKQGKICPRKDPFRDGFGSIEKGGML